MTVMDFPSSPINGQTTTDGRYYFDSSVGSTGAWRSTPLPVGGLPAGSIIQWSSSTAPANWLICDGSAVSRSVYSSLFAVIGTTYGTGDGTTTFNLPDLRGRVPVGKNGGTFGTLAATGGAETHTLTTAQMPSHTHIQNSHTHTGTTNGDGGHQHNIRAEYGTTVNLNSAPPSYYNQLSTNPSYGFIGNYTQADGNHTHGFTTAATTATNQNTGGDGAHNNLQPYLVVNYIIKVSTGWTAGDSELATRVGSVESRATALETANATTNKSGLVPVIPTSVVVGSGTSSVDTSGTVTFSGVSSVSLNGIFTSAYRNYRILIGHNGGSGDGITLNFQFRSNGTNASSGYYYSGMRTNAIDGSSGVWSGNNTGSVHYGYDRTTATTHALASIDVGAPQVTQQTTFNIQSVSYSGTAFANITASGVASIDQSHDGISLVYGSGTHSGNIRVYGYR